MSTKQNLVTSRNQRINLRASERQEAILKQAALAADTSLTEFILSSAVVEAERVLADRRWFLATDEQYEEFLQLLDKPVDLSRLTVLLSEDTIFDKPFNLD